MTEGEGLSQADLYLIHRQLAALVVTLQAASEEGQRERGRGSRLSATHPAGGVGGGREHPPQTTTQYLQNGEGEGVTS